MGENSEIVVVACDADEEKRISASRFSVTTGQVWFRVRNAYLDNPKSAFEVRTGHLSATVRGTVFSVTATEAESRVSVYEGRVHVVAAKKEVDLASGQVAEVAAKSPPNVAAFTPEERAAWAQRSEVLQPTLGLTYPRKAVMTRNEVTGVTDPGCAVTVNGNAAPVDADGGFATRVPMQRGANTIEATATGADGLTYTVKEDVRYLPVKK
jgi:hypothetical protein